MAEEYTEGGSKVYRYEDKEQKWKPPTFGKEGWSEKIEQHMEKHYGTIEFVFHEIVSDLIHVDVHHIKPSERHPYNILFTTGMSYLPMTTPVGYESFRFGELMICLPPDWPISDEAAKNSNHYWPIYWLKMLARLPHQHSSALGSGHTIPNGNPPKPLSRKTTMNGIILLPPTRVSEDFHTLNIDAEHSVHFYTLVPLYKEEMNLKLKEGSLALIDKFDENHIDELIDLNRRNVCKRSFFSRFRG